MTPSRAVTTTRMTAVLRTSYRHTQRGQNASGSPAAPLLTAGLVTTAWLVILYLSVFRLGMTTLLQSQLEGGTLATHTFLWLAAAEVALMTAGSGQTHLHRTSSWFAPALATTTATNTRSRMPGGVAVINQEVG